MKIVLLVIALVVAQASSVLAADKKTDRNPSSVTCVSTPTIECIPGYIMHESKGCWKCVSAAIDASKGISVDDESKTCINVGTLTCQPGYRQTSETVNGKTCFHCTMPAITEPSCIKTDTLTCMNGYRSSEDENKCFHCIKM